MSIVYYLRGKILMKSSDDGNYFNRHPAVAQHPHITSLLMLSKAFSKYIKLMYKEDCLSDTGSYSSRLLQHL